MYRVINIIINSNNDNIIVNHIEQIANHTRVRSYDNYDSIVNHTTINHIICKYIICML